MGATLQPEFNAQTFYVDLSATPAAQAAGQAEFYASFGVSPCLVSAHDSSNYCRHLGFFFMVMSLVTFFFVIASVRTNIIFVLIFLFIDLAFLMLTACYWTLAQDMTAVGQNLQIV